MQVINNGPLNLDGELELPCPLYLPSGSACQAKVHTKGGIEMSETSASNIAMVIADMLATFDPAVCQASTAEAYRLMRERNREVLGVPSRLHDFSAMCPGADLRSDCAVNILSVDYVNSREPLIYITSSVAEAELLARELPEFYKAIYVIKEDIAEPSVYCVGDLLLTKGFEVITNGGLTVSGDIQLPDDFYLKFVTKRPVVVDRANIRVSSLGFEINTGL